MVYTYYADGDDHGSAGDLQTATHEAWIDDTWTATETHYYRYWKDAEGNGFQHGMKYAVGPEAYLLPTELRSHFLLNCGCRDVWG